MSQTKSKQSGGNDNDQSRKIMEKRNGTKEKIQRTNVKNERVDNITDCTDFIRVIGDIMDYFMSTNEII